MLSVLSYCSSGRCRLMFLYEKNILQFPYTIYIDKWWTIYIRLKIRLFLELFDTVWNEQKEVTTRVTDLSILPLIMFLEYLRYHNWCWSVWGKTYRKMPMNTNFSESTGLATRAILSAAEASLHLIFPHNLWLSVWESNRVAISSGSPSILYWMENWEYNSKKTFISYFNWESLLPLLGRCTSHNRP